MRRSRLSRSGRSRRGRPGRWPPPGCRDENFCPPRRLSAPGFRALTAAPAPLPSPPVYATQIREPASLETRRFPKMADHGTVEYATATGNDYPAHENTYERFLHFTFT